MELLVFGGIALSAAFFFGWISGRMWERARRRHVESEEEYAQTDIQEGWIA